ncbi:MAG: HU family DNA-binding protein [Firmicutes bacterium]|nr:HU family DNA-binding protein [Bacillota bacterium]
MNKAELIQRVSEATGLKKKDASRAVDAVLSCIRESLSKGQKVSLVGFGSFEVRQRSARQGRNPQTGKALRISARRVPVFRAGRPLKEAVNH